MKLNLVQPKVWDRPTVGVELVNQYSNTPPSNVTTPSLLSTVPLVSVSENNIPSQLTSQTLASLISQQAVANNKLSDNEKVNNGVISDTIAGVNLKQLTEIGSILKPGTKDFIQQIKSKYPKLPDNYVMSKILFTGNNGVKDIKTLKNNVNVQLQVLTNSAINATNNLVKQGIFNGKESSTEIAGVIMAASMVGSNYVADILKNPKNIASTFNSNSELGKLISGGKFAANLADRTINGMSGVVDSLTMLGKNSIEGIDTTLANVLSNNKSIAQNAFKLAEQSFGTLKSGVPNVLVDTKKIPTLISIVGDLEKISNEKNIAEKKLSQFRKLYRVESTDSNLKLLREAENNVAALNQQIAKLNSTITTDANHLMKYTSIQKLNNISDSINNVDINGVNLVNNTVNNIVGNATNTVNVVEQGTSLALTNVKNIINNTSGGTQELVGNLKNNFNKLVETANNSGNLITAKLQNITNNASATVENLTNNLNATAATLLGGATALINSIGKGVNKLKLPSVGTNTFADVKSAMESVFNSIMDPKIPVPNFDEVITKIKPKIDISNINNKITMIKELNSNLEVKSIELDQLFKQYNLSRDGSLLDRIEQLSKELEVINENVAIAQRDYSNTIT